MKNEVIELIKNASPDKEGVCMTVGCYKDGKTEFSCWRGEKNLPYISHKYEIGSITKTFTGLLAAKAVIDGKINFEDSINKYITELDQNKYWPTIRELVSHTSGIPMDDYGDLSDEEMETKNDFFNVITREKIVKYLNSLDLKKEKHPAVYSNNGTAAMGIILERVYKNTYVNLVRDLLAELDLKDTSIIEYDENLIKGVGKKGNICDNWIWSPDSALVPAGALISTPEDMIKYGITLLTSDADYIQLAKETQGEYQLTGTRIDAGCFIMHLRDYNIFFHTGGTGCFNTCIAIDETNQSVWTSLSNTYLEDELYLIKCMLKAR